MAVDRSDILVCLVGATTCHAATRAIKEHRT
jgi:hypothetical protein